MMEAKSRGGRPRRTPAPGERVPLGLRVTPKLKQDLDTAAKDSGRSQSQEAEFRLDRSFHEDRALGGAKVSAMTNRLTATFAHAGQMAARADGHKDWETGKWVDDPGCFRSAMMNTIKELVLAMPGGVPSEHEVQQILSQVYANIQSMLINSGRWASPYKFDKDQTDG